jgi:glycosyltransferase involved in cell wall biosynthesis
MLADPDELAAMGQRGMAAVRDKYNWSSESQKLIDLYKGLLNENKPS